MNVLDARSLLVLLHLRNKLDDVMPKNSALLRYREKVVQQDCPDLADLLKLERNLEDKAGSLLDKIRLIENDWKKKDLAVTISLLKVVEKKRKETSKELNRRIVESEIVSSNIKKLVEQLDSIKVLLERKCDPAESTLDGQTHETTFQKMQRTIDNENVLVAKIVGLKRKMDELVLAVRKSDEFENEVEEAKLTLSRKQKGDDPYFIRLHGDILSEKDAQTRLVRQNLEAIKEAFCKSIYTIKFFVQSYSKTHYIISLDICFH